MHAEKHPQAGQRARLSDAIPEDPHHLAGSEVRIEDWWDHLTGGSWMDAEGNPAALVYAIRAATAWLPLDDDVVYVKRAVMAGGIELGHLVHSSEIAEVLG